MIVAAFALAAYSWTSQSGMCLKFLLTRILRRREVQFKRPFFNSNL